MTQQRQAAPQGEQPGDRRSANVRLGLILASVAVAFFLGFVAKLFLLGR